MADGSAPNLTVATVRPVPAPSRELLSSRSPYDAALMNVEPDASDPIELIAYPRGWFTISTAEGSVDLNRQTARLMAEAILKELGQ
jgi:hypothetical protein